MSTIMNMNNKVCIITGVGKGIGYATAKLFKQQGAKLALITRSEEDLFKLKQELNMCEDDIYCESGDVSEEKVVKQFVSAVYQKFGRIDVLINNAGMRFRKNFLEISYDEWQNVLNVNLGSTFLFCKEVGTHMVNQKSGIIVNMASIVGTLGLAELTGYASSKGAIISLTKSLALEWAEYGIRVNAIAPGFFETSYTENFKKKEELYQFTLERTPMKRWGSSEDIANTCLYLSSNLSSYVTGEVLSVDGGWSAW